MALTRRRPLLRAAAIRGGAYYAGIRRQEEARREHEKSVATSVDRPKP